MCAIQIGGISMIIHYFYTERPKKNGTQTKINFFRETFLLIEGGYYIDRR